MKKLITALGLITGLSLSAMADNPHVTLSTEMGHITSLK